MFSKPFDEITKADIDTLIAATPEGRELEYKAELPKAGNAKDNFEFPKDVSAFANAAGGYILYGIAEKRDSVGNSTGVYEVVGLSGLTNADAEITRLEQVILRNIAPRIFGFRIRSIDGFPKGPVIILHVPKSWNAPHMVMTDNSRFFSRRNALSQSMDVQEIRSAFLLSAEMPTLIRRFRDERLGRIMADETPVNLLKGGRVVMHLIPFASMRADTAGLDLAKIAKDCPRPLGNSSRGDRYNFDGWISYSGPEQTSLRYYLQVFRSGALEATMAYDHGLAHKGNLYFNPWGIEEEILNGLERYVKLYEKHEIEPPVVVAITLLQFKGATIPMPGHRSAYDEKYVVDRDTLLLPDVLLRDYGDDLPTLMRPAFDALWQASNVSRSMNYDEAGKWSKNGFERFVRF